MTMTLYKLTEGNYKRTPSSRSLLVGIVPVCRTRCSLMQLAHIRRPARIIHAFRFDSRVIDVLQ